LGNLLAGIFKLIVSIIKGIFYIIKGLFGFLKFIGLFISKFFTLIGSGIKWIFSLVKGVGLLFAKGWKVISLIFAPIPVMVSKVPTKAPMVVKGVVNGLKITARSGATRFIDNSGRVIINAKNAGKILPIKSISPKLALKYKKPIIFNKFGYPNFSAYSKFNIKTTKLTGNHQADVRLIEKIARQKYPKWKKQKGYTWHHHQDAKTMQYVPTDLHSSIPHSGGASRLRVLKE